MQPTASWERFDELQRLHVHAEQQTGPDAERTLAELRQQITAMYYELLGPVRSLLSRPETQYELPTGLQTVDVPATDLLGSYYALINAYCANSGESMQRHASAMLSVAQKQGIPLTLDCAGRNPDDVVRNATTAVNAVLLSQKKVVLPSVLGVGVTPMYQRGSITSDWTRHSNQHGQEGWSATVEWEGDTGTTALFFDRYALTDLRARRRQSNEHFQGIQRKSTPYSMRLMPLLAREGIDEEQYDRMLEGPRLLSEEIQHIYDRARINDYKARHPNIDDNRAVADTLLADTAVHFRQLQRDLADPSCAYLAALSISEFAGQVGGLIQLMSECIEKGEHATAFAHFLNYAYISDRIRSAALRNGRLAFDGTSVEPAYAFAAHRVFQDMPLNRHTPEVTVHACFAHQKHPAHVALELLQAAYKKNIRQE